MRSPLAWVVIALLAWLVVFQAARLYTTPLAYDDAYLAAAAKSLALGHGYATHYPSPQPFDVRLGVGLALQVPAAGLIALLGNRYWVPGLATAIAIDVVLLAILVHLRRRLEPETLHRVAVGALAAFAVMTADGDEWILSHWYTFLGDIPAALAVILGILLLSHDRATTGVPSLAAGLVLGAAVQVKLITALGMAPAVADALVTGWRSRAPGARREVGVFAAALLLPGVAVQLWQLWALGGLRGYRAHLAAWRAYLGSESSGSGLSALHSASSPGAALLSRGLANGGVAMSYLGAPTATAALVVLGLLIVVRLGRPFRRDAAGRCDELRLAGALLSLAFVVHTSWWLFLSANGWSNHLLPSFLYLAGAFALALGVPARTPLRVATYAAAALVLVPRLSFLPAYLPSLARSPALDAALEVRETVIAQKRQGLAHLGCGWWVARDLEYLLPDVGNFQDCLLVDPAQFPMGRFVLVRNLTFWNWERSERLQRFADTCEQTLLFRNAHYTLSRCTRSP
jgi:hypothetical protein